MWDIRDIEEQPFLIYHLALDLSHGILNRERLKNKRISLYLFLFFNENQGMFNLFYSLFFKSSL